MKDKQLLDYRANLLEQIRVKAESFCAAARAVKNPLAPFEENGWNTHQLVAHVWHVDLHAYGMRVRRTMQEEYPVFQNYDGDGWMANEYSPSLSLESMLTEFSARITEMLSMLHALVPEGWSRLSRHETAGELSLQTWVERGLAHIEEHLATIQKSA